MDKNIRLNDMLSTRNHFRYKDTTQLKVKEQKKIFHANINQRTVEMVTVISHNIHFKSKIVTRVPWSVWLSSLECHL